MYLYIKQNNIYMYLWIYAFCSLEHSCKLLSGGKMDFASEHGLGLSVVCVKVGLYM